MVANHVEISVGCVTQPISFLLVTHKSNIVWVNVTVEHLSLIVRKYVIA